MELPYTPLAVFHCPSGALHLYSPDAIGMLVASFPRMVDCTMPSDSPSQLANAACDTADLIEGCPPPSPPITEREGFSMEEWITFAKKKARIASNMCRANGRLKAQIAAITFDKGMGRASAAVDSAAGTGKRVGHATAMQPASVGSAACECTAPRSISAAVSATGTHTQSDGEPILPDPAMCFDTQSGGEPAIPTEPTSESAEAVEVFSMLQSFQRELQMNLEDMNKGCSSIQRAVGSHTTMLDETQKDIQIIKETEKTIKESEKERARDLVLLGARLSKLEMTTWAKHSACTATSTTRCHHHHHSDESAFM
jgi:hypothetical protein